LFSSLGLHTRYINYSHLICHTSEHNQAPQMPFTQKIFTCQNFLFTRSRPPSLLVPCQEVPSRRPLDMTRRFWGRMPCYFPNHVPCVRLFCHTLGFHFLRREGEDEGPVTGRRVVPSLSPHANSTATCSSLLRVLPHDLQDGQLFFCLYLELSP
jgi:hypothetical protein